MGYKKISSFNNSPQKKVKRVVATSQEAAEARREMRENEASKQACFRAWLKANPDEEIQKSRGEQRARYLEQFLVLQARMKKAKKDKTTYHDVQTSKQEIEDIEWMTEEQMKMSLGEQKTAGILESKILKPRPCRFTGSEKPHMLEYPISKDMLRNISNDMRGTKVNVEAEASERDITDLEQLANPDANAQGQEQDNE